MGINKMQDVQNKKSDMSQFSNWSVIHIYSSIQSWVVI